MNATGKYYTDLFSPETYHAFSNSDRTISGFRTTQSGMARNIQPGDLFICYVTRLSRWVGLLEVQSASFEDSSPIFVTGTDPFSLRFKVKPLVWLPLNLGIPIHDSHVWSSLSFTRAHHESSSRWTGQVRNSLRRISDEDGRFLEQILLTQAKELRPYPFTEEDQRAARTQTVRRLEGEVSVTIPSLEDENAAPNGAGDEVRESIRIQALLARIGHEMGMKIWIPASDRRKVLEEWPEGRAALLDVLPLNYDEATLGTIERIDVLWLKGRSIRRAFEVEHTTSIYSGILRMADLLALQPNMAIRLHLVAPPERRKKVFEELRRPVFSLLEKGPLSEICTFLSYESLRDVLQLPHLSHTNDSILDEYEEVAE